jgi:hypothetical protein
MIIQTRILHSYRQETFRISPGTRVKNIDEAIDFVNQRGFIFFWPITGIVFPSLWAAVAGDRPVADAHDDPGHVTWGWKDSLLGSRQWYYAKVLRRKATMIAFAVLPYFYALSENYGSPEEDYLSLYQMGKMTQEAKSIYEAVLDEGPLDTVALRKKARLSSQSSESRFNRALADLQADFKILPVAVTQSGAWRYAFAYDIAARHYPELDEQARSIDERTARLELTRRYFLSLGAARPEDLRKLFAWRQPSVEWCLDSLVEEGFLRRGLSLESKSGEVAALTSLLETE